MKPSLEEPIEVRVRVFYKGEKAQTMNERNGPAAFVILRTDLTALKLPHPKIENVSYALPGCVQFYWITDRNGVLHQHVRQKIATKDAQTLNELSIGVITYEIREIIDPTLYPATSQSPSIPPSDSHEPRRSNSAVVRDRPHSEPMINSRKHLANGDDAHTVRVLALTKELQETRRAIATAVAREMAIMKTLDGLGALPPLSNQDVQSEPVMRERLSFLEKEVEVERRKRVAAEAVLEDVQRECREPFVVPALLQTFVSISKLTNEVPP